MKLYEIYTSIQGETHFAGRPCTLVRFAGCDLRCGYCDTEYAFTGGREVSVESIVSDVEARGVKLVLLTGGEPLLQVELPALARALIDRGFEVMIETGGHRDTSVLPPEVVVILDVKTPGSGEHARMSWPSVDRLRATDAAKFVVCSERDYEWARDCIRSGGSANARKCCLRRASGKSSRVTSSRGCCATKCRLA